MTWNELKIAIDAGLAKEGMTGDEEVHLDMEPDQEVKNWAFSTRFDGVRSVMLTSHEYDPAKCMWWMTCIRCGKDTTVYGERQVCYTCDPTLYPPTPTPGPD
jgi:hypothetical protein